DVCSSDLGEHASRAITRSSARGPSPRVRGALSLSWDSSGAGGRFQPLPIGLLRDAERFAGLWTHNGPEPPREVPARAIPGSERARPGPVWRVRGPVFRASAVDREGTAPAGVRASAEERIRTTTKGGAGEPPVSSSGGTGVMARPGPVSWPARDRCHGSPSWPAPAAPPPRGGAGALTCASDVGAPRRTEGRAGRGPRD